MNKRTFKDKVYGELAGITRAMANPHRLEIIELLAQGEFSVEEISRQASLSVANTSQHLQVLKAAQLVEIQRLGNFIFYRLANPNVFRTWKALRDLGVERLPAIERLVKDFRQADYSLQSMTIAELREKTKAGLVTVLDVRPAGEYSKGHISNAISIPIGELADRLKELPKQNKIVAYCRGPFCVFADEAVALLHKEGFDAVRLTEGFPDWQLEGLPVTFSDN